MSTNFFNTKAIRINCIGIMFLFTSISIQAHQLDLSTVLISQDEKGKCFLQIYSSLSAFEGEIDYKYSMNAYKTPEEFRALVIEHFKKNVLFIALLIWLFRIRPVFKSFWSLLPPKIF